MFKLYSFFSSITIPLILINIFLRVLKNKEDKNRYIERFGKPTIVRPKDEIIWIHASSIGEFKSSHSIIEEFSKKYSILVTTTTKSAADYVKKNYSKKVMHQYAPFDIKIWILRFLKYWKPKIILWIESDLWPNTLNTIKNKQIKCIYLNARISPKSFRRWKFFKNNYSELLNTFNSIFAQSLNDQLRLKILSNNEIEFIGNLKLANKNFELEIKNLNFEKNNTIMFASTHLGEEEKIYLVIKKLIKKDKNLKFIIAPRHPERSSSIANFFKKNYLPVDLESSEINISKIKIIDSFGNLENYFKKSDIVFLGGSLTNNGGHNPIEAARHNCAIISGQNVFNWQNVYDEMVKKNACYLINNSNKLLATIENLINNDDMLKKTKINAKKFSKNNFFDDEKIINLINNILHNNA